MPLEDLSYHVETRSVGGGGYAWWTLRALSAGNVRIEANKRRPWEGDRTVAGRFSLAVEI